MKKLSWIVACVVLAGVAAMAAPPVYSVNAVGYTKVTVLGTNTGSGKLTMVAVPFVPVGTGKAEDMSTLDAMIGTNGLVAGSSPGTADSIQLWNGTAFATAFLCNNFWVAGGYPETEGKWCYMAYDPGIDDSRPYLCAATNTYSVWAGRGFWIRNRHATTTLTIAGEVPAIGTNSIDIAAGLTMVAYPYPVAKTIATLMTTNEGALPGSSPGTADNIQVWNGSVYATYFYCNNFWVGAGYPETEGKWCYMAYDPEIDDARPYVATNAVLKPGDGFWYRSRHGAFTWPEPKPYTFPE
jgi:hypothetical protein